MKKLMELIFKGSTPRWLTIAISVVVAVCAFVFVLFEGGATEQKITAANGAEYLVSFELNDGLLNLIDDCKLKEVGNTCEVKVGVRVIMVVAPTKEVKKEEVVEEKKEEAKEAKELPKVDLTTKPIVKPVDVKVPIAVETKEEEKTEEKAE